MKFKILSFDGKKIERENVISVTLKTKAGEITVLDNHVPLLTSVKPSTMYYIYTDENNIRQRDDIAIWNWVVEVSSWNLKIMVDMLVDIDNLDIDHVERAKIEAEKIMTEMKNNKDKMDMEKFIEAEDSLLKSIAAMKLYEIKQ